ncbi:MAG: phosphosulfolactate synthase [Desulfovibrionaceae bacterium]
MILPKNWTLDLPERTGKPRTSGLTMISDKGLGLNAQRDIIDIAGGFIDLCKFSIGSAVITGRLEEKIRLYQENDIRVYFGGTTFEKFYAQGKLDYFLEIHRMLGVGIIEVSDGTITLPDAEKFAVIERFAKEFTVIAEVGCKDECVVYDCEDWIRLVKGCFESGSWKVTIEGRESGTAGIYDKNGAPRTELDAISETFSVDELIIEAPKAKNQIEMINRFGANVNLGNVAPTEVLVLESQRVGLRYDTF